MNSTAVLVPAASVAALVSIVVLFMLIPVYREAGIMTALISSQIIGLGLTGSSVYKIIRANR
jgi:hypothetical protein